MGSVFLAAVPAVKHNGVTMSISASMVKDLREKTGAGMMDCKKALEECGGELEKAVDWLRQKGLSKAAKRADRATSEGLIGSCVKDGGKLAVLVEVKCETDFVARGDKFKEFVKTVAERIADRNPASLDDDALNLRDQLNETISATGENITLGRFVRMQAESGIVGSYVHANGKIAALVEVKSEAPADQLQDFAKNVAMQIAAASPLALDMDCLDPALVEREREVYRQKAREEGKPENIIEKIAEGAVKKYANDVCLLDQPYIRDDKMSIRDLMQQTAKTAGSPVVLARFVRMQLGAE